MADHLLSRSDKKFIDEKVGEITDSLDALGKTLRETNKQLKKMNKEDEE